MKKKGVLFVIVLIILVLTMSVDAFVFNGTTYDINGNILNYTNITVLVKNSSWAQVTTNTTMTNAVGEFNLTLPDDATYMYQPTIEHHNITTNDVNYVGQSLPMLPYSEFSQLQNVNYYLKESGMLNITVVNSSNTIVPDNLFAVQIKDTLLGYPLTCNDDGSNDQYICNVPKYNNYSITIYPSSGSNQNFVPITFNWNNFSAAADYTISELSNYNASKKRLNKQFNTTESFASYTGYINSSDSNSWDEFTVVPYLLEPGNMISMSMGALPFNTSAWTPTRDTDSYNLSNGFYNISLPYSQNESVSYMLFAAARNGSNYYGSFINTTVIGDLELNFTMYGLLGDYNTINQTDGAGGSAHIVNTSKLTFHLMNSTGYFSNMNAHIEIVVDYSNYGAVEFTFMTDISGSNNGSFAIPLLNITGFKEMNIYTQNYAPKRLSTKTVAQLQNATNTNITMATFNPGAIPGESISSTISISLYRSNTSCNIPNPSSGCVITDSTAKGSFNPMKAIFGGGDVSFRMGVGGVLVHYMNVNLLASGPPDAAFEENSGLTSSGNSFEGALRFGSLGPTIYDYVLVSVPYSETAGSGLDDSQEVNMSIPIMYDDDWNVIWNTTTNGTNASNLASNYSHYSARQSEWETLLGNVTCTTNAITTSSLINATNPCYIDTTNNRIWVRLPHFSGTGPTAIGSTVAAASSSSGGGGGGSTTTCSESWACIAWSDCSIAGFKSRTCSDANSCGTTSSKPSTSQSCVYVAPAYSGNDDDEEPAAAPAPVPATDATTADTASTTATAEETAATIEDEKGDLAGSAIKVLFAKPQFKSFVGLFVILALLGVVLFYVKKRKH
ncbi:MAG: hypothetical protein ABIG89_05405 [Candidatus Woesearchaeota archaeon]